VSEKKKKIEKANAKIRRNDTRAKKKNKIKQQNVKKIIRHRLRALPPPMTVNRKIGAGVTAGDQ